MAEACRHENQQETDKCAEISRNENFYVFNVLCIFISLVVILADLTTDILVVAEYCKGGSFYWALATLSCILVPNVTINVFSLRWFTYDEKSTFKLWLTHCFLVGFFERCIIFLRNLFACQKFEFQKLLSQRNDLCLLHFLYIFTGTVPQIILQTHAIITLDDNYHTKVFALVASNTSLIWGCTIYMYSILAISNENVKWTTILLRLIWHFGMLIARIAGILLFTVIFGVWTLLPLGLHWIGMIFWIFVQNTTFCSNKVEESFYNIIMGFVYCFSFVNLREGHTRYRLIMFYTLMVTQNFGSLFLYVIIAEPEQQNRSWSVAASVCIIFGTIIGITAMIFYYKCFHSKGPLPWKYVQEDIELNNKVSESINENHLGVVRTFKCSQKNKVEVEHISKNEKQTSDGPPKEGGNEKADKSFLLEHWIARAGTPTFTSAPINANMETSSSSIQLYTVENTPQSLPFPQSDKKIKICSPTELTIKLSALENLESSIDDITSKNFNSQKRRGICSSDELRENLADVNIDTYNMVRECFSKSLKTDLGSILSQDTDNSNKKTSSDSIDMDLDLSFSDINSSDINTFNENIVQKLCLSALKNIKVGNQDADIENIQRIALDILKEMYTKKDKSKSRINNDISLKQRDLDTPTENLSVHDYENICAVNIAREAWGLRSWNGYCDIENWLHDGSVVRDRRRDTLTSGSSEISSCISQDLKNAILAAPAFSKKSHTYSNVFVKFDKTNQEDYLSTTNCNNEETFVAKPCFVDNIKDPNYLEPIMEELDDIGDIDIATKLRLNSESSLVATIDEIRKVTVNNSPRNLYHRRELWDSPQSNTLQRALWKEPSKCDSSNIMESLPEKENTGSKFTSPMKEINFPSVSSSLDLDYPVSYTNFNKNTKRRSKSNICQEKGPNKVNNKCDQDLQDLSSKDIDYLWNLVSENTIPVNSTENLSLNRRTSSMQSLIHKDLPGSSNLTSVTKVSNVAKVTKNKPRRKFSILRERFEHKVNLNSDEEILYSDGVSQQDSGILNVKKKNFDSQSVNSNMTANNSKRDDRPLQVPHSSMSKNIKEKRSLFMRQVLSPPKFNTKLKYKI